MLYQNRSPIRAITLAGMLFAAMAGMMTTSWAWDDSKYPNFRGQWRTDVEHLAGAVDWDALQPTPGNRLERTEHFAAMHDRITEVFRIDPTATW